MIAILATVKAAQLDERLPGMAIAQSIEEPAASVSDAVVGVVG